ncbi:MAG: class I SAM-dependent methyltransferase [Cyclobacteriaceae bacterium]
MKLPTESDILRSWDKNAQGWMQLIEENRIESRRLVTNDAIIRVLASLPISKLLDLGCGEGWLVRRMEALGLPCHGIDGSKSMIQLAIAKGGGSYQCLSYGGIIAGASIEDSPFDAILLNFSLFDKDSTPALLQSLKAHLTKQGLIIIQSLHPDAIHAFEPSHWKPNVWEGLPGTFSDAYPWYHRSMPDWKTLFTSCGLCIKRMEEPEHPQTQRPASVIFVLEALK